MIPCGIVSGMRLKGLKNKRKNLEILYMASKKKYKKNLFLSKLYKKKKKSHTFESQ